MIGYLPAQKQQWAQRAHSWMAFGTSGGSRTHQLAFGGRKPNPSAEVLPGTHGQNRTAVFSVSRRRSAIELRGCKYQVIVLMATTGVIMEFLIAIGGAAVFVGFVYFARKWMKSDDSTGTGGGVGGGGKPGDNGSQVNKK